LDTAKGLILRNFQGQIKGKRLERSDPDQKSIGERRFFPYIWLFQCSAAGGSRRSQGIVILNAVRSGLKSALSSVTGNPSEMSKAGLIRSCFVDYE
jgi:hypothetical protein